MYGRIFESLYEGSMVGKGSPMFAVWCYVIAKMREDKEVGAQVNLNPALLCHILGEEESVVDAVIKELCEPDPKSNGKDKDGRRLVRLGEFAYQVVNGAKYAAIKNAEAKRESDRNRKAVERANVKAGVKVGKRGKPLAGEAQFVAMEKRGEDVSLEPGVKIAGPAVDGVSDVAIKTVQVEDWGNVKPTDGQPSQSGPEDDGEPAFSQEELAQNEEEARRLREEAG